MNQRSFWLLPLLVTILFSLPLHAFTGGNAATDDFAVPVDKVEFWKQFEGKPVRSIEVEGLKRTRKQTIEWMMGTKTLLPFQTATLATDLQVLYNTGNLYDLDARVTDTVDRMAVDVVIILKDKWTLFPGIGVQGGGGSTTFGGGLFEANLLGYMAHASVTLWTFNGTTSYDVQVNQEYFHGTQAMWSVDLKDSIEPQIVHGYDSSSLGQFAWRRRQKEVMIGTHLPGRIRAMLFASVFEDTVVANEGAFRPTTGAGLQQSFYPRLIFGRVNWTNYLEEGSELTLTTTATNLIGSGTRYGTVDLAYKKVWIVGPRERDNAAMYLSTSHMTEGGPNYQYQVGGYYNVRGYSDMRAFGSHTAVANFEYRPFLFSYRWSLFNVDLMAVQAAFFTDTGSAWGNSTLTGEARASDFRPLWSAGAGLRINMVKFSGAILRLDVARTISPDEGTGFSFGVGQFF